MSIVGQRRVPAPPSMDLSAQIGRLRKGNPAMAAALEQLQDSFDALAQWALSALQAPLTELTVISPTGAPMLQVDNTVGIVHTDADGYQVQINAGVITVSSPTASVVSIGTDRAGSSGQADSGIVELFDASGVRRLWGGSVLRSGQTTGFMQMLTGDAGGRDLTMQAGDQANWGIYIPSGRVLSHHNLLLRENGTNVIQAELKAAAVGADEYGLLELRKNGTAEQTYDANGFSITLVNAGSSITKAGVAYTHP